MASMFLTDFLYCETPFKQFHPFTICVFLLVLSLIYLLHKQNRQTKLNLPPSPPRLPIIGNLHQLLGNLPHHVLTALSKKYGPLLLLQLGQTQTVVVSSADLVKQIVKNHDVSFSNRPKTIAVDVFLYGCQDIGFVPYGEYWRQVRKIVVLELLSPKRVQSFQFVKDEEVGDMVAKIRSACLGKRSVNLTDMIHAVSNNIIARCVIGQKVEEEGKTSRFGEISRRMLVQYTDFSFGDIFPSLFWMDYVTGLVPRLKRTSREMDELLDSVIEEHRSSLANGDSDIANKDLVHILLEVQKSGIHEIELTQERIKAILVDMFVGGIDSTSTTTEWTMSEIAKHPEIRKKAQDEIRRVLGKKTKIEAEDINQMKYLKCVIKETFRLHPPAALLVPRETLANVELGGYCIPSKTRVLTNAWAIHRDPELWDRPEEFVPERFENSVVDFKAQEFHFIPFGSGRKGCPGVNFGVSIIEFVIANLLHWFDWKLGDGGGEDDLDMSEAFGLTVTKRVPLVLLPELYSS